LSLLSRLMGPDSQKLATMRLMAQAGRLQEAATLARSLFPDGPPTSGSMALEYYQIVSSVAPADDTALDRALQQQYTQTGDVRYRILALQRQLRHGSTTPALLNEMARLADQPGTDEQAVRSLWSWAIDKLPWNATPAAAQAYLQRYPQDTAMQQHLAKAHAALGGSTGGTVAPASQVVQSGQKPAPHRPRRRRLPPPSRHCARPTARWTARICRQPTPRTAAPCNCRRAMPKHWAGWASSPCGKASMPRPPNSLPRPWPSNPWPSGAGCATPPASGRCWPAAMRHWMPVTPPPPRRWPSRPWHSSPPTRGAGPSGQHLASPRPAPAGRTGLAGAAASPPRPHACGAPW
jgi:hypothetical protein